MSTKSHIEWTESTWNPLTGCTKISSGCLNCYAERMAKRLQAMGQPNYRDGFNLALHPEVLTKPLEWKKPQMIFVNSMSDLFHKDVPLEFVQRVFDVMNQASWHTFQVLTKRAERLQELSAKLTWTDNIWMGVTIEDQKYNYRASYLKASGARVKFLSLEPLIGSVSGLTFDGIDWVITGGESGPGARPIKEDWVVEIRDECMRSGTPFFFKQWGGVHKKKNGRLLHGRIWSEFPAITP